MAPESTTDAVLVEIPAGTPDGIMTCFGDNEGFYAVKFPDGRIIFCKRRVGAEHFTKLEIAKLKELASVIYPEMAPGGKPPRPLSTED